MAFKLFSYPDNFAAQLRRFSGPSEPKMLGSEGTRDRKAQQFGTRLRRKKIKKPGAWIGVRSGLAAPEEEDFKSGNFHSVR